MSITVTALKKDLRYHGYGLKLVRGVPHTFEGKIRYGLLRNLKRQEKYGYVSIVESSEAPPVEEPPVEVVTEEQPSEEQPIEEPVKKAPKKKASKKASKKSSPPPAPVEEETVDFDDLLGEL